ncbi:MAG: hypothetical protein B7Y83_09910 [Flavobacteriales bacterium 32-34-25]|nr:MAG: hypothetical protein B7Y83_09910 [Flavobacteriales bacterium 32-34-25]
MKNGGGHFAPELGGHFKLELGGQYYWNLQKALKSLLLLLIVVLFFSCAPKSYFTEGIRKKVEAGDNGVNKLQFYVDRDVELRREVSSGDVKITSGKVKFENGKFIHIIILKEGTRGVCTKNYDKELGISFEIGDNKVLSFGTSKSTDLATIYHIYAQKWIDTDGTGRISYDNQTYYIQPQGSSAQLMIKKSIVDKLDVKKRNMKGVKI